VAVGFGVAVGGSGFGVAVKVGGREVGVQVRVGVAVGGSGVDVAVCVGGCVGVAVDVGVCVGVADGVQVAVAIARAEAVAVGDGKAATGTRVAPASQPPRSAASRSSPLKTTPPVPDRNTMPPYLAGCQPHTPRQIRPQNPERGLLATSLVC
jgi:hypothetical protein